VLFKNDPFKHGFYEVNGYRTFSKLEAIELQNRTGHWPDWNFNKEIFQHVNWQQESPVDLMTLYRSRARQIREAYDYVVIFYSGGSDSNNILGAWLKEGLKIDEIASFWNIDGAKDRDDFMNDEIDKVVLPRINQLKNNGYEFKFRLIDLTEHTVSFIESVDQDYKYYVNNHWSPNNIVKNQFRERIGDYADLIAQGKTVCFVWGIEKPQIFHDGDRHFLQFFDIVDNCVTGYTQSRVSQGWYDELFYWTPDMPELLVKQAHTLLRFVETCDIPHFYQSKFNRYGYNRRLNKYLTSEAAKIVLYPTWDPNTYCNGKASSMVFSERDRWFWSSNIETKEAIKSLGKQYFNTIGDYWLNKPNDPHGGIKCHASPKYYLY
jgi:hypothetical protein